MNFKYFLFCQGDLLLTKEGTIPCGDEPPVELKPWEVVTRLKAPTWTPSNSPFRGRKSLG